MSYFRVVSVILAGVLITVLSGLGGYFWASQVPKPQAVKQASRETTTQQEPDGSSGEEGITDTGALTPENWEAFLQYEGKRKRMLGVNKKYSGVNFRSGPGTTHSLRKTPSGGTLLMPIDRISNWFRARTRDGSIGWIHKSVVRQLEVPLPIYKQFRKDLPPLKESTKELIPEDFKKHNRVKVLETKVNLRQGPGTQFAIAGRIYKHEEVRLFGKKGDWYRIKTVNGLLGWVHAKLVEPVWKTKPKNQKTIKIKTRDPRMAPEYQFSETNKTRQPIDATLLEIQQPWAMVKVNDGTIGWVHQKEIIPQLQSLIEQSSDPVRQRP